MRIFANAYLVPSEKHIPQRSRIDIVDIISAINGGVITLSLRLTTGE